jgi:hypothetical protein
MTEQQPPPGTGLATGPGPAARSVHRRPVPLPAPPEVYGTDFTVATGEDPTAGTAFPYRIRQAGVSGAATG